MIVEIQRQVLNSYIDKLATDKGVSVHPLLKDEIINSIYTERGITPGSPLTAPFRQESRSTFDVEAFNKFFETLGIDSDTLFKLAVRARIEARQMLLLNDVRMRSFSDRIQSINLDAQNFNSRTVSKEGIFESQFSVPIKFVDYTFSNPDKPLDIDTFNGVMTLPADPLLSKFIDLSFLKNSPNAVKVQTLANISELIVDESTSPFGNLADQNASPWIHNVSVNNDKAFMSVVVTIDLPAIEEVNKIIVSKVPGGATTIQVETALVADNFIPAGTIDTRKTNTLIVPNAKIRRLRLTITNSAIQSTTDRSDFMIGLRSLSLSRMYYHSEGEVILQDINPDVAGKTIVSLGLKADSKLTAGSTIDYSIKLAGQNSYTEVAGTEINDQIQFSIAKVLDLPTAVASRSAFSVCPERNNVKFNSIVPVTSTGASLMPSNSKVLDRFIELWPEQNCFKQIENPEYTTINIQDARITFGPEGYENRTDILVPLVLKDQFLQIDDLYTIKEYSTFFALPSTGSIGILYVVRDKWISYRWNGSAYIVATQSFNLPLPLAFNTIAPTSPTTTIDRMKTESYGLFKVEWYYTTKPDETTDITSLCTVTGDNKIEVSGTYPQTVSFNIHFLGRVDSSVYIKNETLMLHNSTGQNGINEANVTPYSLGLYHISSEDSKVYATKQATTNVLANTSKYINFTGIFTTPKLTLYETYVTFASNVYGIRLDTPITVDSEAGEYATLRRVQGGQVIRLEKTTQINDIIPGTYLLSVMTKPMRLVSGSNQPSAIQSVIAAKINQLNLVNDPNDAIKTLFSMTSGQQAITSISTTTEPLKYRVMSTFLNRSTKYNNKYYSSALINGDLILVISESGYDILPIDGQELMRIKFMYFDRSVYNGQETINLKVRMSNANSTSSLSTPEISGLTFKLRYV